MLKRGASNMAQLLEQKEIQDPRDRFMEKEWHSGVSEQGNHARIFPGPAVPPGFYWRKQIATNCVHYSFTGSSIRIAKPSVVTGRQSLLHWRCEI